MAPDKPYGALTSPPTGTPCPTFAWCQGCHLQAPARDRDGVDSPKRAYPVGSRGGGAIQGIKGNGVPILSKP